MKFQMMTLLIVFITTKVDWYCSLFLLVVIICTKVDRYCSLVYLFEHIFLSWILFTCLFMFVHRFFNLLSWVRKYLLAQMKMIKKLHRIKTITNNEIYKIIKTHSIKWQGLHKRSEWSCLHNVSPLDYIYI